MPRVPNPSRLLLQRQQRQRGGGNGGGADTDFHWGQRRNRKKNGNGTGRRRGRGTPPNVTAWVGYALARVTQPRLQLFGAPREQERGRRAFFPALSLDSIDPMER